MSKKVKAQNAKPESLQKEAFQNGHDKVASPNEDQLASKVQNRLEHALGLDWLQSRTGTKSAKLIFGWLIAITVLAVIQVGLLLWNSVALARYAQQSEAEWQAEQLRAAMANRPLLDAQPQDFICPDNAAMQELALSGIQKTVCTLSLTFTNHSTVYAAEAALFEEMIVVAEGREFEQLEGIDYEIREFMVQPDDSTTVEIPFTVTQVELGPEADQDLLQIHVQVAYLADENSPVAGEYWYRYHWQYSPRGFTLKSSESQIPEIAVEELKL